MAVSYYIAIPWGSSAIGGYNGPKYCSNPDGETSGNITTYLQTPQYIDPYGGEEPCEYYVIHYCSGGNEYDWDLINDTSMCFAHDFNCSEYIPKEILPPGTKIWEYEDASCQWCRPSGFGDSQDPVCPYTIYAEVFGNYYTKGGSWNTWINTSGLNYEIYVNQHSVPKAAYPCKQSFSVTANHTYRFTVNTYSEEDYDGIMVSTNGNLTSYDEIYMDSEASETPGYIGHCSGNDVGTTFSYTPTSNGTIYFYFRTDASAFDGPGGNTSYCYGHILVTDTPPAPMPTVTVTFNDNGGSGGPGTRTVNQGASGPSISYYKPTRGNFGFLGYYDSADVSSGTQYYDYNGFCQRTFSSNITLYAHWENYIDYDPSLSFSTYTDLGDDITSTSTTSSRTFTVTSTGWSCASGGSISITDIDGNNPGWGFDCVSNDGRTISIPAYTPVGSYTMRVWITSPQVQGANGYMGSNISKTFTIHVYKNYITNWTNRSLIINQLQNLPAYQFVLNWENVDTYFYCDSGTGTAHYSNGTSGTRTFEIDPESGVFWFEVLDETSFESLGTQCTSVSTVQINPIDAYYEEYEEAPEAEDGGEMSTVSITGIKTSATRAANTSSLTLTKGADPITVGGTTSLTVKATFTSGSVINDASGSCTYTTNPTNKISIS